MRAHAIELAPGVVLEPQGWAARLGRALHQARVGRHLSLRDLARESGGRFSVLELRAFEHGRRPAGEQLGSTLARLYGIDLAAVMPPSRAIEIDLERGVVAAGGAVAHLGEGDKLAPAALSAYLELVWALRGTKRSVIPLRTGDVAVLADALSLDEETVVAELAELMRCSPAQARHMLAALRTRAVAVPLGVVMLLAGGALAVDQAGRYTPASAPPLTAVSTPSAPSVIAGPAGSGVRQWPGADHLAVQAPPGAPRAVGSRGGPALAHHGTAAGRAVGLVAGASTGPAHGTAAAPSGREGGGSYDPGSDGSRGGGGGGGGGAGPLRTARPRAATTPLPAEPAGPRILPRRSPRPRRARPARDGAPRAAGRPRRARAPRSAHRKRPHRFPA